MGRVNGSEGSAGFLVKKKTQGKRKVTILCQKRNMCADLVLRLSVKKSYQQNKIIREFAASFSFILVIPKHH